MSKRGRVECANCQIPHRAKAVKTMARGLFAGLPLCKDCRPFNRPLTRVEINRMAATLTRWARSR